MYGNKYENDKINIQEPLDVVTESFVLPFPLPEFERRLSVVRKMMLKKGIDLMYITSPESMYYISGLNMVWYAAASSSQWDGNKAVGIAIHVKSDKFILFQMADEYGLVLGSTCSVDSRIKAEINNTVMCGRSFSGPIPGEQDILDLIIDDLVTEGWLEGTVALELGAYRPPANVSMQFQDKIRSKGCRLVDGTDIVKKARRYKSPLELNCIRKAAHIADIGHKAILNDFKPGMTELDIVGIYTKAMMNAGGESMGIVDMVRSGEGKLWSGHPQAARRKIMPGEPIAVDLSGVYNRYHANVGRFYYYGRPKGSYPEYYARGNIEVMKEAKKLMKPNMYVRDFFKELKMLYKELGVWNEQCFAGGYEIGIAFPPDWCGEFVYDISNEDNDDRFEPGMVVNFETGVGVIDTVIFTEDNAEFPSETTYELIILGE